MKKIFVIKLPFDLGSEPQNISFDASVPTSRKIVPGFIKNWKLGNFNNWNIFPLFQLIRHGNFPQKNSLGEKQEVVQCTLNNHHQLT